MSSSESQGVGDAGDLLPEGFETVVVHHDALVPGVDVHVGRRDVLRREGADGRMEKAESGVISVKPLPIPKTR